MRLLLAAFALIAFVLPAAAAPWKADPGPERVEVILGEWVDADRDGRAIPYKIYLPTTAKGPRPVVIFSHGLGGSREGAAYLGEHLASWGYIAIHIQHPGSDRSVWEGMTDPKEIIRALTAATRNLAVLKGRFEDVPSAVDHIIAMNASGPLKGRIDVNRIGMSGHSFGAVSTMVAAGMKLGRRGITEYAEPRFKAFIAYSPNTPRGASDIDEALSPISRPMLHFTGTNDMNPLDKDEPASNRQLPFRHITAPSQYLVVLNGGDHMVFGGEGAKRGNRDASNDDAFHRLIGEMSVAFWDAYLMDDPAAKAWLKNDAATELGTSASYEMRN
jgi:predicted dienelactone hydrolase